MPNPVSEQAAARIEDISKNQGMTAGYNALQKEYESFKSSHNAADTAAFWKGVEDKLQKDKVLPELAVAWADKNRQNLSRDGDLTKFDLRQVSRHSDSTDLDKSMSRSLNDRFEQLKNENADKVGGVFGYGAREKDAITSGDLTVHLRRVEQERTARIESERQVAESKSLTAPLFKNSDGNSNHTLFKTIDALPGGVMNDKVNALDLQRYLDEYKVREHNRDFGTQFNPENKRAVENLLKNWNTDAVRRLQDANGDITPASAAKAAGFKDAGDMIGHNKIQSEVPPPRPEPPRPETPPEPSAAEARWREMQRKAAKTLESEIHATGERVVQPGDTLWSIARANIQVNSALRDVDKITNQMIMEEMKHIKRLNGVDEKANWMPKVGKTVKLYEHDD